MNLAATPTTPETKKSTSRVGLGRLAFLCGLFGLFAILGTCSPRQSSLDEVKALGVLRVATVNSPTSYYIGQDGEPTGFDYDLAKAFADELGVKLELVVAPSPPAALDMVEEGVVHMAAASLAETPGRRKQVRFSQPLLKVAPTLVYRRGTPRPENLGDLHGTLRVGTNSAPVETLREMRKQRYPQLKWDETDDDVAEELLYQVSQGTLDYTIVNSDLLAINQRYYPNLRAAFTVSDALDVAWAFRGGHDSSLANASTQFFAKLGKEELARIKDRYFGHVDQVDSQGALTLATHVDTRLTRYRAMFQKAADSTGLDWRLLAAIGYQESHWDPTATSPTGVRGIMMLTNATASFLNVANREDPSQSIAGGARYFKQIADQLPTDIPEPDRTWMALAAYNMGVGHLIDARDLTAKLGGNPNRWLDVRHTLPLLSQSHWYRQTQHGYARGHQAVIYVGNIRAYYDMLVWITRDKNAEPKTSLESAEEQKKDDDKDDPEKRNPLNINSPVL
ncbi:membrane-bound lytic murein transglycosylase MltF [Solimonas marina]|uniref:Membrane-bound lytic murein transglycosylase F n=1 Tax=Solimonas marina TaxID=2714601 RepID=A0A969WCA4_9GAMM|nr:membrane-bound lytic murein transglycosylase MltF [Solimonas marina]NKF23909.1 membrane-bound lytic murein transglycosylase MltF [Solimonas marina]